MDVADRVAAASLETERIRAEVVEGGEIVEVDGLVVALSNLPAPELNGTRVARDPEDPARALAAARAVFRSRGHAFFGIEIEVGRHPRIEEAIRGMGLERVEAWPAMAVEVQALRPSDPPDGVAIRRVTGPGELTAVREVEVATFGTPAPVAERFVGRPMLEDDRVRMFLAWDGDRPVGEATGYVADRTVGVFGVGVIHDARRRGIGAALTLAAACAFPDAELAWLQPSEMAASMYRRLGFETVSDWEVWAATGQAAPSSITRSPTG
jgi:GNAT superfamily N-acetyltransferase